MGFENIVTYPFMDNSAIGQLLKAQRLTEFASARNWQGYNSIIKLSRGRSVLQFIKHYLMQEI